MAVSLDLGSDLRHLRRSTWTDLPNIITHATQSFVKKHPMYARAKAGDAIAAEALVDDAISEDAVQLIETTCDHQQVALLAVHAIEIEGMNAIPRVFARAIAERLDLPLLSGIIQSNRVAHTGASGFHRLAFPALFEGVVRADTILLVDDFVGQGGTLANIRGFVESRGASVIGATALTGRADSIVLRLKDETLRELRSKHGDRLEEWWLATFGYSFERLTESEARYLIRSDSFDSVTENLAEARGGGNR